MDAGDLSGSLADLSTFLSRAPWCPDGHPHRRVRHAGKRCPPKWVQGKGA
jgi:hypothetical protein